MALNLGSRIRRAAHTAVAKAARSFLGVDDSFGWSVVYDGGRPETDFQQDIHRRPDRVLANWAVFACISLIAGDVAKMRIKLVEQDAGLWNEVQVPAFSPVLRKPNAYQTRQQFVERWLISKLTHGNAYILKERDDRGVVVALYVLDPHRVRPMVSEFGAVFYELHEDNLAKIGEDVMVPASEIIHDRWNTLYHDLCGLSPLYASHLAAEQGLNIQRNSRTYFGNSSRPAGVLVAPGFLTDEQARAYKERWDRDYGPGKAGKTIILGNGLEYKPVTQNAVDSQLVEQLKLSAEMVCTTFHVPGYKVGIGEIPPYQSAAILKQVYYDNCLHKLIEALEACLDEGLGLTRVTGHIYGTECDLDALMRMDEGALTEILKVQVGAGISSPNEARRRLNQGPVKGGESPMTQQQNYSLQALAKRDAKDDPFASAKPMPAADPAPTKALEEIAGALTEQRSHIDEQLIAIERRISEKSEAKELADALIAKFMRATYAR